MAVGKYAVMAVKNPEQARQVRAAQDLINAEKRQDREREERERRIREQERAEQRKNTKGRGVAVNWGIIANAALGRSGVGNPMNRGKH